MSLRRFFWGVLVLLASIAGCETQENFPHRPITLVCPWSPGGGTDQVSRKMAFFLETELGVPCTVINATGGQGVTGHRRGMMARPDGYTIAVITFELNTLHHQNLTTLTYEDMIPLVSVNEDAAAIWVPVDSPWETLDDLVADIQSRPGELTASGTATGGAWHLAFAGWLQSAGIETDAVKWIPKGGADPSIQELMSGGIDLVCCSLPEAKLYYDRGELRSLGVMAEETVPGFEDIPTMREQNYDWVLVGWRGFAVPLGTPEKRVRILREVMQKIVKGEVVVDGDSFPEFMHQRGFNNRWRESEDFRAFLARNDEALGDLLHSKAFASLAEGAVGPYDFPILLGGVMICLVVVQMVVSHRQTRETPQDNVALDSSVEKNHFDSIINVGCGIAMVLLYLAFAETVGYVILVSVLLFLFLVRLGTRWVSAVAMTVFIVPFVYSLFSTVLRVPLPRGWLGW
ncbi:MAG: tripartite tricarboxylate transporter TctB family protein [Planctomycetaceae bacterium]|nr:tripartite tricarboxylate transporter TctB family protein [Planctomycetaceae bacterium]